MHLYRLYCSIRAASENPEEADLRCIHAGLDANIRTMITAGVTWRDDVNVFRSSCQEVVRSEEDGSPFWRGVALVNLGATSTGTEDRFGYFHAAMATVKPQSLLSGLDREYIRMITKAGIRDTPRGSTNETLEDIVNWLIEHGAYEAPGRAEVLIRKLLAAGERRDAFRMYARVIARRKASECFFSPPQMARLEETIETSFRMQ